MHLTLLSSYNPVVQPIQLELPSALASASCVREQYQVVASGSTHELDDFDISELFTEFEDTQLILVRDSSAVRQLFVRLAGAVGRQSALHKENSGFAAPTLGRHISTFRGYRILFAIRNLYINRFTNHFSIHSYPSYPQKVVLHSITARFSLRPYHFVILYIQPIERFEA